ncbi:dynamin family protein [Kocuria rosea]|uniref:dynamin family protein n=1 Tax=Kocuria rosea TaxID=1275 RepID=UPI002042051C|nr:dynamin family protein [Kocuria rosea]MCM3686712.1 dynamin family protein [Kocuria rosea]
MGAQQAYWHNEAVTDQTEILRALEDARALLAASSLPLSTSTVLREREDVQRAVAQLDDYVLPRVRSLDAPLLAVVGGSTGAGKSTLVNAIVGHPVTRSGAIRPTTRQPILIHHPRDAEAFSTQRVLPHLSRIHARKVTPAGSGAADTSSPRSLPGTADGQALVLLAEPRIPEGVALLDAPDVDSISDENRRLAGQLLAAADLWLFVTTANRYADAVPWRLLVEAAQRDITVAVVLDRVPPGLEAEIQEDLGRMLAEQGLADAPVFVVPESPLNETGMLPPPVVAPVVDYLAALGRDAAARSEIARRTLGGAVRSIADRTDAAGDAVLAQQRVEAQLRADVERAFEEALASVVDSTRDGTLLRGEVLARWQDFVGTGEFFRNLEAGVGRMRDRLTAFFTGRPAPEVQVEEAIETGLQTVIVEEAARAAETAERRWQAETAGRVLLGDSDLGSLPADFPERTGEQIRAWQSDLMALIQREGAGKRTQARAMSLGVNALTVILMIGVFSMTGGLTGLEVGIAGGSGVVGTKLLEAVFGEDAVRRMAEEARRNLEVRIHELMDEQADVFLRRLDVLEGHPQAHELKAAAERVRAAGRGVGDGTTGDPGGDPGGSSAVDGTGERR